MCGSVGLEMFKNMERNVKLWEGADLDLRPLSAQQYKVPQRRA